MKKPSLWLVIAFLGIGYLAGGKDDKPSRPSTTPQSSTSESTPQAFGLIQPQQTQRSTNTPPPVATSSPFIGASLYTSQRANMRVEASTKSKIITVIDKGQLVKVLNVRGDWHSIDYRNRTGWISSNLLSSEKPVIKPAPTTTRTLPAQAAAPVRQSRAGQPTRQPYVGTCDCPYDLMRNGRRCGGRSAYSRPGGRNPQCYF